MRVLDDKSIIKADSRLFWTPILVGFPYNYLDLWSLRNVKELKSVSLRRQ